MEFMLPRLLVTLSATAVGDRTETLLVDPDQGLTTL